MSLAKHSTYQLMIAIYLGQNHMPTDPDRQAEIQGYLCLIQAELATRVATGRMGQKLSEKMEDCNA